MDEKRVLRDIERKWGYEGMMLGSCENFIGKWEELLFDAFRDPEPVERAEDGSDMTGLVSLNNSMSKRVPGLLEMG